MKKPNVIYHYEQDIVSEEAGLSDGLLKKQMHSHKKTCRRKVGNRSICRFSFPKYPLPRTMVLRRIEEDELDDLVCLYVRCSVVFLTKF